MKTNKTTRVISVLLAMIFAMTMLIALPLSTSAAGETGSITVYLPGSQNDDPYAIAPLSAEGNKKDKVNVTAYQVLKKSTTATGFYEVGEGFAGFFPSAIEEGTGDNVEVTYSGGKLVLTPTSASTSTNGIILTKTNVESALASSFPQAALIGLIQDKSADAAKLADWLTQYVASGNFTTVTGEVANGQTSVTLTDVTDGYWLVVPKCDADNYVYKSSVLWVRDGSDTSVTLKIEWTTFEKGVKNAGGETYGETTTAGVGKKVYYEIKIGAQDLSKYTATDIFKVSDTLVNQVLTYVSESDFFEIYIGGTKYTTGTLASLLKSNGSSSTLPSAVDTSASFTLDFDPTALSTAGASNKEIKIRYAAKLTEDATYNTNTNHAAWEYSNKQTQETNKLTDDTTVYSFGIDADKTFADGNIASLYDKVEFELRTTADSEASAIKFVEKDAQGSYVPAFDQSSSDSSVSTKLKLTSEGKLNIHGLAPGTYYLVETKYASEYGYKQAGTITIVIGEDKNGDAYIIKLTSDTSDGSAGHSSVTGCNGNATVCDTKDCLQFSILNEKESTVNVPETGGMGIWLAVIGGMMVAALGAYVFGKSRTA